MAWEELQTGRPKKQKETSRKSQNKEFARVTYFFVFLFLALMIYLVYFNTVQAKDIINSPYNERQDNFADRVIRGAITDRNGIVLAETEVLEDGTEVRHYPQGALFAHVVGYSSPEYGKTGLESVGNFNLLTSNAFFVEKIKNEFQNQKNWGDTLVTTLDLPMQQAASDAMGDNKGAIFVMEASTGKILVMLSKPSYDPNEVEDLWYVLNSDEENSPFLNRVTQGLYAPGSTFKIVTALEYMRENADYANYSFDCTGTFEHQNFVMTCWTKSAQGHLDLRGSFAQSCNCSFANIALTLDRAAYRDTAEELLFNQKLPSLLDYSKSSFAVTENTGDAELMMTAMGQGNTLASPYHMGLICAAIANGGTLMEPYLVDRVTNYTGTEISKNVPKSYRRLMSVQEAAQLKEYMSAVVSEGTATALGQGAYSVAGKTGTAEYSLVDGEKMHSWFVGFTNVDNPELVICVTVEGYDGNASALAVPIAKQVLDAYYNR